MEYSQSLANQAAAPRQTVADRVAAASGQSLNLEIRPRPLERAISIFLFISGALSILTTVGFTVVLGREALNFFAETEWLNINKATTAAISAEDTTLKVATGGTPLTGGDIIRLGQPEHSEIARVVNIIDAETVEIERGVEGTTAEGHDSSTPIYTGAQVTLAKFFTSPKWAPEIGNFGILPLVTSTFVTSFIAMLVAVPLGLGAAIYLSEYASQRARRMIKPMVEILAGVPTVVYGYFALTFVTPLLRSIFGLETVQVYNMASAGLVIGILIIPTIASISEDSLHAVPNSLREASYGLGATRLETVYKVLLPAALSGISAAIILGISRAVGETMIVLIAAGAGPNLSLNPFAQGETMAGHIARISTGDISRGSIQYNSVFAIGLTLFVATLLLNFVSTIITRRFREIY